MSAIARRCTATSLAVLLLQFAPPLWAQDAAEGSSASAPGADAPSADAPSADAPSADATGADAPSADAPSADAPSADAPGADAPGADAPGADAPGADAPGADAPGTEEPGTEEPGTTASAVAEGSPSSGRPPTPRVAVVLIGDPDPPRRAAAEALDALLDELGLQRLGDVAVRAALLGEVRPDDGLERLHAARRRLLFDEDPASALGGLGERLRVNALVVIRPTDPARVAVFDIAARSFYEEEPLLSTLDATARFVRRAARAAARRAAAPPPANVARATEEPTGTPRVPPEVEAGGPARRWLRAHWPYIVGGALLVGVITGFVVRGRRDSADPAPILRFRPGVE